LHATQHDSGSGCLPAGSSADGCAINHALETFARPSSQIIEHFVRKWFHKSNLLWLHRPLLKFHSSAYRINQPLYNLINPLTRFKKKEAPVIQHISNSDTKLLAGAAHHGEAWWSHETLIACERSYKQQSIVQHIKPIDPNQKWDM
jgi:hypothetical protein